MKESTTSLLRLASIVLITSATILTGFIKETAETESTKLGGATMKFDLSTPFDQLTEEQKRLRPYQAIVNQILENTQIARQEAEQASFVSKMLRSHSVAPLTYLSAFFIVTASLGDYLRQRPNNRGEDRIRGRAQLMARGTLSNS